jgi:hypothetical protein
VNRAFDELEGTMRSTSTQGKMTSCQAAIIFMTGDSVAAASELNTVFNERNDDALGARLFLYTMGRDLGAVPSSSPVCTSVGGDIGKVAKEGDIIDQLQGFFRLGAASIKTTAERVVRWWGAAHARSRTTFHLVSGDISVDAMAAKLLEVPNSKYGRSYAFLIDQHGRVLVHPSLRAAGNRRLVVGGGARRVVARGAARRPRLRGACASDGDQRERRAARHATCRCRAARPTCARTSGSRRAVRSRSSTRWRPRTPSSSCRPSRWRWRRLSYYYRLDLLRGSRHGAAAVGGDRRDDGSVVTARNTSVVCAGAARARDARDALERTRRATFVGTRCTSTSTTRSFRTSRRRSTSSRRCAPACAAT